MESGIGEGIFFAGDRHAAIKVVASGLEKELVTSDPKELLAQEKKRKQEEDDQAEAEESK